MLSALELAGFKSFADKTRFEFPAGITVIVGPNGSGKSNVVDAIKWVLGEQSVKSLRGKEMADVIFKGSPAGGRKAMNYAEATIVFDNADGRLPVESSEVRVTRRVYRSGEGEYLINGQACRLKDIKDLFRGTGVGTDAYSLIEQGKVDRMLQASPKERRAMFEEAAGISRFKAKKIETQRRLERVGQNLVRLADIVEEVESRLRTVRAQAGKARQYRQWQERLLELRTQVGITDWHQLTRQWQQAADQLERTRENAARAHAEVGQAETELEQIEERIGNLNQEAHEVEQEVARCRETLAACRSTGEQLEQQWCELNAQRSQLSLRHVILRDRAGDVDHKLEALSAELACERQRLDEQQRDVAALARVAGHWRQTAARHREASESWQQLTGEQSRLVSHWDQEASRRFDDHAAALKRRTERRRQLGQLERERDASRRQRDQVARDVERLKKQYEDGESQLAALRHDQQEEERLWKRRKDELAALQNRLSGLRERADLLRQLEERREGVGAGPREVLQQAASAKDGPYADVVGLAGDCFDVPLDVAPLVDCVLGPRASAVVLRSGASLEPWQRLRNALPGRVQLLPIDRLAAEPVALPPRFHDRQGEVQRLSDLVDVVGEAVALREALLGSVFVVDDLPTALAWHDDGFPYELVTRGGEQVLPDGTVALGPGSSSANLVSRRSELRVLLRGIQTVSNQIRMSEEEIARMGARVSKRHDEIEALQRRLSTLKEELADYRVTLLTVDDRLSRLGREIEEQAAAGHEETAAIRSAAAARESARRLAANARRQLEWLSAASARAKARWEAAELEVASVQEKLRSAEIALARREQFVDSLSQQRDRFEKDRRERARAVEETGHQLDQVTRRRGRIELKWLRQLTTYAACHWELQQLRRDLNRLRHDHADAEAQRRAAEKRLDKCRRAARRLEQQVQQQEMETHQWQREREQLEERYLDDYQIDLPKLVEEGAVEEESQREAIDEEITMLRQRIATMGAVNMEALEELEALEERFSLLSGQYNDMVQAKAALERIIHKINGDSRRLFTETLETIRRNFQALYRKSFGGGHADLVLEDGVDVLEAGIDIVATPPGKPSFNNSLLSGGERALTAVALLLAIFQHRPSPFCVLDEVDAPFDEANIGRFIEVLKDFLGWTRFVIVTHSKKTMTAADTLYGITMQESGVSKQVSVRFEDVNEKGEIRSSTDDEQAA